MKQQHQLRYHTQKKCGVCQQQFANQMELRAHYRQNHEIEHNSNDEAEDSTAKENESNFRCDTCGICESSIDSLSEHIALHDNQLKCVVCGTILKHKANLVLHMRIHVSTTFLLLLSLAFMSNNFSSHLDNFRRTRNSSNVINVTRLSSTNHLFECICKRRTPKYAKSNVLIVRCVSKRRHN